MAVVHNGSAEQEERTVPLALRFEICCDGPAVAASRDRLGPVRRTVGTIVATALVVMLLAVAGPVRADVFTVSHVKVDETAKDAASAKVKAIGAAQVIAFRRLIQRITPAGSIDSLPQFGVNDVSPMTSGLTFEEERTGPTRYIATLTVSFLPDTVRELLYQYSVPIAEEQAAQILLVPVWKTADGLALWDGKNPWKDAWLALDLEHSLTPTLVPIGDLTDISAITAEEAIARDSVKLEALRLRYGVDNVVVSVAEQKSADSIYITLRGETSFGLLNYGHAFPVTDSDVAKTSDEAAQRFLFAMEETWKSAVAELSVPNANLNEIIVAIPFDSLSEWNSLRASIQQTFGVAKVEIDSLSARGGIVKVRYEGSIGDLSEALRVNGLILSEVGGTWVIQPYF